MKAEDDPTPAQPLVKDGVTCPQKSHALNSEKLSQLLWWPKNGRHPRLPPGSNLSGGLTSPKAPSTTARNGVNVPSSICAWGDEPEQRSRIDRLPTDGSNQKPTKDNRQTAFQLNRRQKRSGRAGPLLITSENLVSS